MWMKRSGSRVKRVRKRRRRVKLVQEQTAERNQL